MKNKMLLKNLNSNLKPQKNKLNQLKIFMNKIIFWTKLQDFFFFFHSIICSFFFFGRKIMQLYNTEICKSFGPNNEKSMKEYSGPKVSHESRNQGLLIMFVHDFHFSPFYCRCIHVYMNLPKKIKTNLINCLKILVLQKKRIRT